MAPWIRIACLILLIILGLYGINILGFWIFNRVSHPEATEKERQEWQINNFNPDGFLTWNTNPGFDNLNYDGGLKEKDIAAYAPLGQNSWGMYNFAWSFWEPQIPLDRFHAYIKNGQYHAYLKHGRGWSYGVTMISQGTYSGNPSSKTWHCPKPLNIKNKKLILSFDARVDQAKVDITKEPLSWLMMGVNVWYRSPHMPKPLVMDVMFYSYKGVVFTQEDEIAYHYQYVLNRGKNDINKWQHYDMDLNWLIDRAVKRFKLENYRDELEIVQLDILIEAVYAEGAFTSDNLGIYYQEIKP